MRKTLVTAAMSISLILSAAMPAAVFAEEAETEIETEEETEAEEYSFSDGYDDRGFFEGVTALDYVTLPEDYMAIPLADSDVIPSDSDVQSEIDSTLSSYSTTEQLTEGVVEDGATVNIDYVGSIDGEEFDGGSTDGAGTTVTIGVTSYIDGFLDQLVGHEVGETFDINVTFPEDYGVDSLNGQDAVFKITINYIEVTTTPELTDDFVKENLSFDTAEEYRQSIYDDLYESNLVNGVLNYLVDNSVVSEVPASATDAVYDYEYNYISTMCYYYGMDIETYFAYVGGDEEALRASCETYAGQYLILQAAMEDAGLEVTPEFVMELNECTEEDYDGYVEYYGLGYVNNCMMPQLVGRELGKTAVLYTPDPEAETVEETEMETEAE